VSARSVVLLSGGLDSTVTAAVAARDGELALLHLDYGQRTRSREHRAFLDVADHYGVPESHRMVAQADYLARIGGSALTDSAIPVPNGDPGRAGVPITYVPFRNAHLLSLGVSWAEVLGADAVFLGAVEEDSSGYPDCTEAFCRAFGDAVSAGTPPETRIRIETPVIHTAKADIVRLGVKLHAPLHLTWSCYEREDLACGRCDSCLLRGTAFRDAGIPDPIPYVTGPQ
jgi:7-cyano-7-deazaguanine synthase